MAEGHIEFTLFMSVFVCVFICMYQNRVRTITSSPMVQFENNLAQIIIMTRQCVVNKNHVTRSKIKVTVCIFTLWIGLSVRPIT